MGNTALHIASQSGHAEIVQLLVENNAQVDDVNTVRNIK
jgi:ankyrin repeat protein